MMLHSMQNKLCHSEKVMNWCGTLSFYTCWKIPGKFRIVNANMWGLKGNLAHKFMILYFLCLSFHFDISNTLKTKNIENSG